MKAVLLLLSCALLGTWVLSPPAPFLRAPAATGVPGARADDLPASLARLYPPSATEPVYLQRMLALASSLSGVAADLLEGDSEHARSGFERFRGQYVELAGLVPEWESRFPGEPLEALGAALAAADTERCMRALDSLGAVCHACHVETMVPVQQAHRWRPFAEILCEDPATGGTLDYVKLMRDLDLGLSGVATDAAEGEAPRARAYLALFRTRFQEMQESCQQCHTGGRAYYVDASVHERIDALGAALDAEPLDPDRVLQLVQEIGDVSCSRCHLVHVPAAVAQARGTD